MKLNNKGITLLELIVALTIAAVLALVVVPNFMQYIGYSTKGACETSRLAFMRSYQAYLASGEGSETLTQALNNEIPAMAADRSSLKCPDGGTFSVVNGSIVCSVHGAIGSTGGSSGGSGGETTTLVAGDEIFTNTPNPITLGNWTSLCTETAALPYAGTSVTEGTVYVLNGITYAVKWNDYLSVADAKNIEKNLKENPSAVSWLQKFDPTKWIGPSNYLGSSEWSPYLMNGTVFRDGYLVYIFLGADNTRWEEYPTHGGYWLKLDTQ
ncbi:MAG: type II secretion system protein [Oscillospiraceae bacterium]